MLSTIQYITPNCENVPLNTNMNGLEFEEMIYDLIATNLRNYFSLGVELFKTESTRDGGVDIIIRSPIPLKIMGQNFSMKGKNEIIIYVECKSSKNLNLQLDKFSKNLLLLNEEGIDYFLLVSNSTISPHAFYQAQNTCLNKGINFKFIGQLSLELYLKKYNIVMNTNKKPNVMSSLSICYQTEKCYINGKIGLQLYLFFRNNLDKVNSCNFKLKSDRNWSLSEAEFEIKMDSMESVCKKIAVEKINFDGNNDILLDFIFDGNRKTVQVSGVDLEYNFSLPFCGNKHKILLNEICNNVLNNYELCQMCLVGDAGIGKTRIIDETFNTLTTKGVNCVRISLSNDDDISKIYTKIQNATCLSLTNKLSLKNIMSNLSTNKFKRFLIVIEDLHNAPKEFFSELKSLDKFKVKHSPIYMILTGRDDQTIYNEGFYSYIDWIKHKENDHCFISRKVQRFEEIECKNLIKAIINDAPQYVINRIEEVSQGNPFYLIQYIEYLLETKLIFLVNKNTVGLTNAATFDQHLYIPEKIEDLINLRLRRVKDAYNTKVFDFLLTLSYIGGSCSTDYWNNFFDEYEQKDAMFLFKNHFLKFTNNEITFDHESIYLFLKKLLQENNNIEQCYKYFIYSSNLFSMLPDLKKGEIYLHKGDITSAFECFELPISELKNISNISSVNLTSTYYTYYETIYKIAKKINDKDLQRKTLLGIIYVAMHNLSCVETNLAFEKVSKIINRDFKKDVRLKVTISVLNAHHNMSIGQMSKAKGLIVELLSLERIHPEFFDEQSRFNLFDRASSMYLQENHIVPAIQYNELSYKVAEELNDNKLRTLSKIIAAKIIFFTKPENSLQLINEAAELLSIENSVRINCHNKIGKLTVKIFQNPYTSINSYIDEARSLLKESIDINYPLATIRIRYLLAVLYYMRNYSEDIIIAKKYVEDGIETSIRNGNIKLLPNYYNLKLIIAVKEGQPFEKTYKYANTIIEYLQQQDLMFIGSCDFCNSNLINITNYVIYAMEFLSETDIYRFLKEIKFYGSDIEVCYNYNACYNKNYKNNELPFFNKKIKYKFKDKYTNYFIPLGI